jgi:CHAD domain-containing protein
VAALLGRSIACDRVGDLGCLLDLVFHIFVALGPFVLVRGSQLVQRIFDGIRHDREDTSARQHPDSSSFPPTATGQPATDRVYSASHASVPPGAERGWLVLLDHAEFVVVGGGVRPSFDAVADALRPDYRVLRDPRRAARRTWLDTFDWRLFRAGLTLQHLVEDGHGELSLHTAAGQLVARFPLEGPVWSGRLAGTAFGALGERLAPIVGVRALLPLADSGATRIGLRLLNLDQKTVVRATVEEAEVTSPVACSLAPRVRLTPIRGYGREAQRAYRLLARTPGISPATSAQLDEALVAVGRRPGDYTGRVDVTLAGSSPASAAMACVLLRLLDMLEANLDGVRRDLDSEFLHDLRVSVRRTRSGLTLAGDTLPAGLAARFGSEFKWLGDLTTPVRDLDTCLEALDAMGRDLDPLGLAALEPCRAYLGDRRRAEREWLLAGLRSPRFVALTSDWRAALLEVADNSVEHEPTVARLAAERITGGYNRIRKRGKAITPKSPAEDLHELRKRCKQLRYLLEYFVSLHPNAAHREMIRELKSLQDCLGQFQDSEIQREMISSIAEQMAGDRTVPPVTRQAMHTLCAGLTARQRAARSEFASRFTRFTSSKTAHLVTVLTGQRAS